VAVAADVWHRRHSQAAYFTFGLVWAMAGLAATMWRHSMVFGAFLEDQRRLYRSAAAVVHHFMVEGKRKKLARLWSVLHATALQDDDLLLLQIGTALGMAGAGFGTVVAAFDVRR